MVEQPAGFWIRFGAQVLDGLLFLVVMLVLIYVFGIEQNIGELINSIGSLLYGIIVPVVWYGYTVGKRICGVRIVKLDGSKVGIGTMLIRTLVAGFVYAITLGILYIVSAIMVGVRKDKRSIHDMLAGTYVTYGQPEELNPYQQQ